MAVIYLFVLIVRALKKYIGSKEVRAEKRAAKRTLGETLKAHRTRCQMTQEFEAEALGVSRQTVSKWENGSADPSTTNLLALAKLYGVAAEELLRGIDRSEERTDVGRPALWPPRRRQDTYLQSNLKRGSKPENARPVKLRAGHARPLQTTRE